VGSDGVYVLIRRHIHTIAPHSHTRNNTADLKKLFKSAFYK